LGAFLNYICAVLTIFLNKVNDNIRTIKTKTIRLYCFCYCNLVSAVGSFHSLKIFDVKGTPFCECTDGSGESKRTKVFPVGISDYKNICYKLYVYNAILLCISAIQNPGWTGLYLRKEVDMMHGSVADIYILSSVLQTKVTVP